MSDNFTIFETNQFGKDPEQDFSGQQERIKRKLKTYAYPQLRQNPYFGKNIKKLRGYKPDTWRYRIGDHRLLIKQSVPISKLPHRFIHPAPGEPA